MAGKTSQYLLMASIMEAEDIEDMAGPEDEGVEPDPCCEWCGSESPSHDIDRCRQTTLAEWAAEWEAEQLAAWASGITGEDPDDLPVYWDD